MGTGSPSPTGGSIGAIGQSAILSGRAAAYTGTSEGIFRRAAGGLSVIALSGMATPVGGVFRTFGPPAIQGAASIAFWASIDGVVGGSRGTLLVEWRGRRTDRGGRGTWRRLGGTYRGFEKFIAMSLAGDIAFTAQLFYGAGECTLREDRRCGRNHRARR